MISLPEGKFFSGTSGLVLEEPNKVSFPVAFRDKSRLTYYSTLFNSIEINSSFYKIPNFNTYKRWSEETVALFLFTVKIWKGITHVEKFQASDLEKFMSSIYAFGTKKGCILIQYPAKSKVGLQDIERLIRKIHELDPQWRVAVEIRNPAWLIPDFFSCLRSYNAALVAHDRQQTQMPEINSGSSFIYLRYHGPEGDYKGSYTPEFLQTEALKIKLLMNNGLDVYAYFNNTMGDAVKNLKTLNGMLHS